MLVNLQNVSFAIAILDFISLSHLPSLVIQVPKYLKFSTCFIGFPFRVILLSLVFSYLLITILSVFFILIDRPFSSLYKSTMSSISCNFSFECDTNIISSEYLKFIHLFYYNFITHIKHQQMQNKQFKTREKGHKGPKTLTCAPQAL